MNSLTLKGKTKVDNMEFVHIEGGFGESKKSMLAKDIAEIHDKEVREVNQSINMNRKRFKDGIDIIDLKEMEFAINLIDNGIYTQNSINASKNIYLLSERGYSKLLKILEDDFAWEQYEKLVDGYFNIRKTLEEQNNLSNLSPQLQLLINMELKQKQLEAAVTEAKEEVQAIRDVIEIRPSENWRKETNLIINKICKKLNDYQKPKDEIYKALEERARCNLRIRLNNLRGRAFDNCWTQSRINSLNYLDVITDDNKLIEIYTSIVKEMAIKYNIA